MHAAAPTPSGAAATSWASPHGKDKHTLVLEVSKAKCDKSGDDYMVMGQLMMAMLASGDFTKQNAKDMFLGALNKPGWGRRMWGMQR